MLVFWCELKKVVLDLVEPAWKWEFKLSENLRKSTLLLSNLREKFKSNAVLLEYYNYSRRNGKTHVVHFPKTFIDIIRNKITSINNQLNLTEYKNSTTTVVEHFCFLNVYSIF